MQETLKQDLRTGGSFWFLNALQGIVCILSMYGQIKNCLVSNLYLKFIKLHMLEGNGQLFCDIYSATASNVLMEYLSYE